MTANRTPSIPARATGLIVRDVDAETVVICEATQKVHLLDNLYREVFAAAAGGPTPSAPIEKVDAAVADLVELGLLVPSTGMTRRGLLRSATVAAGVGITTIALPPAIAMASSNVPTTLTISVGSNVTKNVATSVTGKLTRTTGGDPIAGKTVQLYVAKQGGGGTYPAATAVSGATAQTLADGSYTISWTPGPGTYHVYVAFAGDTGGVTYAATQSTTSTVTAA